MIETQNYEMHILFVIR